MSLSKFTGFTYSKSLIYFLLFTVTFSVFSFSQQSFVLGGRLRPRFSLEFIDFRDQLMRLGKEIHLWSVLPAGTLLPLQFLPIVRRKYLNLHRFLGRALFFMLLVGNTCAFGIAHNSFGGTLETRIWVYTLGVMVFFALFKSWVAIRQKRIAEHRVWAIRTWGWSGSIFTMRVLMFFLARFILSPHTRDFYSVTTCSILHELYITHSHPLELITQNYPICENTLLGLSTHEVHIPVQLGYYPLERMTMTITMVFGTSGWLAMVLHMVAVEWWLNWSANESKKDAMKVKKT
ncbi:uncharacterized protein EAE97_002226 [Botrytis byssoidea]|uniref:Uncharacterized protein n=1 Tax=Botrytis byssoidea TaxID=139641 RepID=A0A9P5M283_9HELO|nr:uncharacterized protein EAE97_002226 [Botrytis byssoidea]KAF7950674.1 hypothetical protein EAE97_002226 [Botrytis byssoidea]